MEPQAATSERRSATWLMLLAIFVALSCALLAVSPLAEDWLPLWAAGRLAWGEPASVYDFALTGRPFTYPPTSLLLVAPLSALPFAWSFVALGAASAAALAWVSSRAGADPILVLASPPAVLALLAGQPSLLVIAAVIAACSLLRSAPVWAGLLFAVAALVKPTLVLLAPIALIRYPRAFVSAAAGWLAGAAVTTLLFGSAAWSAWFEAVPGFWQLFASAPELLRNAISPAALAVRAGIDTGLVILLAAVVAVPLVWWSAKRAPLVAASMIMGGSLLVSPYGMNYEMAALAPLVAAMPRRRPLDLLLPALWALSLFVNLGLAGLVAVLGWAAWSARPRPAEAT